jgi:hypothetical protein
MARILALAALAAAISACGDGDGAVDAAPPVDARHLTDAAVTACVGDGAPGCEAEPLTPICSAERNACVECVSDGDCDRDGSFGPSCNAGPGYCGCARDEDCQRNEQGRSCHPIVHACTCILDQDCADGQACALEPYLGSNVRTCRRSGEQ